MIAALFISLVLGGILVRIGQDENLDAVFLVGCILFCIPTLGAIGWMAWLLWENFP